MKSSWLTKKGTVSLFFSSLGLLVALVLVFSDDLHRQKGSLVTQEELRSNSDSNSHPTRRSLAYKHNDFQHLRFLAFGTSRAYGIGVKSIHKSFPFLLSRNNTKNLAMKASGPQYSALCTQTMVVGGDDANGANNDDGLDYDVILFEYNLLADDYLMILAKRLRARYPQATMIFLRIWLPFQYKHVPTNTAVLPMIRQRFGTTTASTPTASEILSAITEKTQPQDWIFNERHDKRELLERIALQVGGHVYHMPRPDNALEALTGQYARFFTPDMNHFTQAGHRFFANQIVKMLHDLNVSPNRSSSTATTQNHATGSWTDQDACELWYETGNIKRTEYHNLPMVQFLTTRHGLEFPNHDETHLASSSENDSSYILVKNPFHHRPAYVWIDFMAGSPSGTYPRSKIRLLSTTTTNGTPSTEDAELTMTNKNNMNDVEIDPTLRGSGPLQVMRHAQVGFLPSTTTNVAAAKLSVQSMSTSAAENSFRIVGIIYTTLEIDPNVEAES